MDEVTAVPCPGGAAGHTLEKRVDSDDDWYGREAGSVPSGTAMPVASSAVPTGTAVPASCRGEGDAVDGGAGGRHVEVRWRQLEGMDLGRHLDAP